MASSIGRSWYVPGSLSKRFLGSYAQLARQQNKQQQMDMVANAANVMFGALATQGQLSSMFAANAASQRITSKALDISI